MLEDIKGLGPKTIEALKSIKIYSLEDLISYYPYRYNVYKPSNILTEDDNNLLINGVIVGDIRIYFIRKNLNKISFKFDIGGNIINVVIFNRAFIKKSLTPGKLISIIGKYERKNNTIVASDIKLSPITSTKIESVYHLNHLIKKSVFLKIMENAINIFSELKYNVPEYKINEYKFISKLDAIREIHFPSSNEKLKKAKLALIYEELFEFMVKINYLKIKRINQNNKSKKFFDEEIVQKFINNLPFKLTGDQLKAVEEIQKDFNMGKIMNRLVIGDVGSGKTIVAFIALYMNYLSGYQGVMMAPTEILARQHYENILKVFKDININVKLLTSSVSKKERKEILEKLKAGEVDILIGTHSVLSDEVIFNNIGLVITDEQHRFGVNQRKNLQNKGEGVDVLFMSATPIPRTLALTLFGDMDISEIKTKPSNRKTIETKVYSTKEIKKVLSLMLEEIKKGHQIYVVAPLIEDEDNNEMYDVNRLSKSIDSAFNKKVSLEVLHGKLSVDEKEDIMERFKNNEVKILVATTVIEVGVDVKNATMMVIFNGERFGLATLHQLRGRIGRNDLDSFCYIISDYDNPRLKIMEETNDGFLISEKDFELRGSGDLFGVRQSGDMLFKIADLNRDFKILRQCDLDSKEFLKNNLSRLDEFFE